MYVYFKYCRKIIDLRGRGVTLYAQKRFCKDNGFFSK